MSVDVNERTAAKARAQHAIDAASTAFSQRRLSETEWQRTVADALADAYLIDEDPRWQSGFDGDPELWRQARELVLDAVPAGGSFLDVGCANGHLIESLAAWARGRDVALTMYGLELNPRLAAVARRRLPELAGHIFTANASDWTPPRRFTYVRTGLEYAAPGSERSLIRHLMANVVEEAGRLLIGPVNAHQRASTLASLSGAGVVTPEIVQSTDRNGKTRYVIWTAV